MADEMRRARRLQSPRDDHVVLAEDEELERWLSSSRWPPAERAYDVVVLFTGESPGSQLVEAELDAISRKYWKGLEKARNASSEQLFFVKVDLRRSPRSFARRGVSKIPTIVHVPRNEFAGGKFPPEWFRDPGADLGSLTAWVEERTGVPLGTIEIPLNMAENPQLQLVVRGVFMAQMMYLLLQNFRAFLSKKGWMFVSGLSYVVSTSGLMFCLLRGMPPFGFHPSSGFYFFYPDKGAQFIFEGFLVVLFNVAMSALWVSAGEFSAGNDFFTTFILDNAPDDAETRQMRRDLEREPLDKRIERLATYAGGAGLFGFLTWFALVGMFRRKVGWY